MATVFGKTVSVILTALHSGRELVKQIEVELWWKRRSQHWLLNRKVISSSELRNLRRLILVLDRLLIQCRPWKSCILLLVDLDLILLERLRWNELWGDRREFEVSHVCNAIGLLLILSFYSFNSVQLHLFLLDVEPIKIKLWSLVSFLQNLLTRRFYKEPMRHGHR